MSDFVEEKPCLVQTGQGFSVKYKNKFLYSRYNPEKNIINLINNIEILPGTLILCISPCLGLGIKDLIRKLPENSKIIGIEYDSELLEFSKKEIKNLKTDFKELFQFIEKKDLNDLPIYINSKKSIVSGYFKRALRIDFSAGVLLNQNFYNIFYESIQNSIGQFWKNRVTLVKFGHKYSTNFFKNLITASKHYYIDSFINTINKPILVLGAGESFEDVLSKEKSVLDNYFIIAVDACIPALKSKKIHVDIVICEESQITITKAFIGCTKYARWTFTSLSSCPIISRNANSNSVFYTTIFDDTNFINNLKNLSLLPKIIPPLGSVGLSAIFIALQLRMSNDIPIYFLGLDFSYSIGKTHAKGTFPIIDRMAKTNKLNQINNYASSFSAGTFYFLDKNNRKTLTSKILFNYANLFESIFKNNKNLFDCRSKGLNLGIQYKEFKYIKNENIINSFNTQPNQEENINKKLRITDYFENEIIELKKLKNILQNGQNMNKEIRNTKIKEHLENREYLYLHFPDGISYSTDVAFLKRVRVEIDYFLKIFNQIHYL